MLSNISWQGYWTALALLSFVYYVSILFIFYRQELAHWLQNKSIAAGMPAGTDQRAGQPEVIPLQPSLFEIDQEGDFQLPPADSEEYPIYACMDELTAFFEESKSSRWQKEQLVQAIKQILSKYPSIKDAQYKSSLGQVILAQSEQYCSVHLKADDVVGLWL